MTGPSEQRNLFADLQAAPDGTTVVINERCLLRNRDGHRVVVVAGVVLAQYTVGDHMAEAHAMVSLVEQGWADQNDVARAFGCTSRTVRRQQERFAENGLAALGHGGGFPRGRSRLRRSRTRLVGQLKSEGLSNRAIAAQIGVTEKAVRRRLDDKIREARAEISLLEAQYGKKAIANPETVRRTMRGFKIAHGKLGQALRAATKRLLALRRRRAAAPARVPVADVVAGEVVKLAPEKKHLSSIVKMVAYQAESDLVRLVAPHYRRADDEGRTLVQSALADSADIEVSEHELRITLAPLSSAHRTRALAALCEVVSPAGLERQVRGCIVSRTTNAARSGRVAVRPDLQDLGGGSRETARAVSAGELSTSTSPSPRGGSAGSDRRAWSC